MDGRNGPAKRRRRSGDAAVDPPKLKRALRNGKRDVASAVGQDLARLGSMGIASLLDGLTHDDANVRRACAQGFTAISGKNDEVLIALCRALRDEDEGVRYEAVRALGLMKARAVEAIPALLAAKSREGDSQLGGMISRAISCVVTSSVSLLIDALNDSDPAVRCNAVGHFADAACFRTGNLALLASIGMHDPVEEVRERAMMVLEQIGVDAAEALTAVMSSLERAERSLTHVEVRTRSLLSQERIRAEVAQFARVHRLPLRLTSVLSARRCKPKRLSVESAKSLLALLRTCRDWPDDSVSERRLHASGALKSERRALGLAEGVSLGTVRNHMLVLASLCGLDGLVEVDAKRQSARFQKGVRKKLALIEPSLSGYVRDGEKQADRACDIAPFGGIA